MSGRTQFWLGSVMLALAVGLLLGTSLLTRPTYAQESRGEGRSGRYALVTGIAGAATNTQSLYIVDDINQILFVFEYHARANRFTFRAASDIQRYAGELVEQRAKRQRAERNR